MARGNGQPPGAPPSGERPSGPPPGGAPKVAPPGGSPPNGEHSGGPDSSGGERGSDAQMKVTAVYSLISGTATKSGGTYTTKKSDVSAVYASNSSTLTMTDATINKAGDSSSEDNSNFYGLNAAVLAAGGSKIDLSDSTVSTSGSGANAIFSTGEGSSIRLAHIKIETTANSSRGLDATMGGAILAEDVEIVTAGEHCAAVATDRGEGTVVVDGGKVRTSGTDSPGIYSTGDIMVSDAVVVATGSEAAVVEGKNSITLKSVTISGAKKCGVMLYQSFSGDAEVGIASFKMTGGSLIAATGPLFYVTNTTATIDLASVEADSASGILLSAGSDRWGRAGKNGGTVTLTAKNQKLSGLVSADELSSISISLKDGSTLAGAVRSAALSIDDSSAWRVGGDSRLTHLKVDGGVEALPERIDDNGFTITYDPKLSENAWLGGKTYPLSRGGSLRPKAE